MYFDEEVGPLLVKSFGVFFFLFFFPPPLILCSLFSLSIVAKTHGTCLYVRACVRGGRV